MRLSRGRPGDLGRAFEGDKRSYFLDQLGADSFDAIEVREFMKIAVRAAVLDDSCRQGGPNTG